MISLSLSLSLSLVVQWLRSNKISLNANKTETGPAKWISKCRSHGTMKNIVGNHGWPTRKIFEF